MRVSHTHTCALVVYIYICIFNVVATPYHNVWTLVVPPPSKQANTLQKPKANHHHHSRSRGLWIHMWFFYFSLQQQQQNTPKKNRPHKFYYTLRHITRRAEVSGNANIHIYRRRICVYLILTFERHSLEKRSDLLAHCVGLENCDEKKTVGQTHTHISISIPTYYHIIYTIYFVFGRGDK